MCDEADTRKYCNVGTDATEAMMLKLNQYGQCDNGTCLLSLVVFK